MFEKIDFEEFIQEVWNQVNATIVSDKFWSSNHEFIREVTYDLYTIYVKSECFNLGIYARLLEAYLSKLLKYQVRV